MHTELQKFILSRSECSFDWSTMMMRYLCATALLLAANVGAFTFSMPVTSVVKESAVKSPLFRASNIPVDEVPRHHENLVAGIQKKMRHVAVVTAAALVWRGAAVPEAHARMKFKEPPPATVMTRVKDLVANDKTATAGTLVVATGSGVVLGRTSVKKNKSDDDDDDDSTEVKETSGTTIVGIKKEIEKLEKKKQEAQKILERIQTEPKTNKVEKKRMMTAAEVETQRIFEQIRIEREEKLKAVKQPGYDPLNLDRFPDTIPNKASEIPSETYVDKLSTRDRVNLLIEKYTLEEEMVNPEAAKSDVQAADKKETTESKKPHPPPVDALLKVDTSGVKLKDLPVAPLRKLALIRPTGRRKK